MNESGALLIGTPGSLTRLERQLDLLPQRPVTLGWVVTERPSATPPGDHAQILGAITDLEAIVARCRPTVALVSAPAAMADLVTNIRTRLRRLGVPDRFMPTLEDQLAGIGPRTHFDIDLASLMNRPPRPIDEAGVRRIVESRRVLITGAGGSIGSELSRIIARFAPESLVLMDRSENALFEIDRLIARRVPDLVRTAVLHDVVDRPGTFAHFRKHRPQLVIHAAAHKHVPMMEDHPAAAVDNNLFGTAAVADAADAVGAEQFVMISTDKAVNPTSIMGATKRLAELYVQDVNRRSDTACSMVRFGNVLGSSGSVLDTWAKQIAEGGPITVTDPGMTRYFMTIPEAAALVIESAALVDGDTDGEVFLLDMGEPVRIVDLAARFIERHGLTPLLPDLEAEPGGTETMPIVFTGVRPGEKLHEELAFDAECMQETRHPDINIWRLSRPDPDHVVRIIESLLPDRRPAALTDLAAHVHDLLRGSTAAAVA